MPFNSIYNDYMYVVDEAKNVGWFVTDRYQEADKVTVYQFKHRDEKVFISGKDSDNLIQAAQLKTYKKEVLLFSYLKRYKKFKKNRKRLPKETKSSFTSMIPELHKQPAV